MIGEDEDELARLPTHDVDPWRAEKIRREAHRALARSTRHGPLLRGAMRFYDRLLEPALVTAVAAVYLAWAFGVVKVIISGGPAG